jgi:hypothetical protein
MVKSKTKKLATHKRKVRRHSGGVGEIPIFTSEYKDIIKVCPSLIENDKYCKYIVPRNLLADTVGKGLFNKNRWEDIVKAVDTKSKLNAYNDVAADIGFEQLTRERAAAEGPTTILPEEGEGAALIGEATPLQKRKRITNQNPEMPAALEPAPPEPASGITNPGFAPVKPPPQITGVMPKRINLPSGRQNQNDDTPQFSNPMFKRNGGKGKHKTRKHKTKKNLKKSRKYRK